MLHNYASLWVIGFRNYKPRIIYIKNIREA